MEMCSIGEDRRNYPFILFEHCILLFQVDGPYAAVKFPPKDSALQAAAAAAVSNEEAGVLLQDVRLLRKDELQVIISFFNKQI